MSNVSVPRIRPPTSVSGWRGARRRAPRALTIFLTAVISGCGEHPDQAESIGAVREAVESANALNVNALNANALNANALALNALNANALNVNALGPAELGALKYPGEAGYLSRHLMKYVVSCALGPAQSFSFSWTDASGVLQAEIYPGQLGLATSWSQAPLDLQGQRWVSACLASRVNWYGASVMLSSRGSHSALDKESLGETLAYLTEEGAFWGNLFTSPPRVFACSNALGTAHARARQRDCAAGHIDEGGNIQECGILHIVGSCAAYCQPLDLFGAYHPRCVSNLDGSLLLGPFLNNPTATTSAITVFLD